MIPLPVRLVRRAVRLGVDASRWAAIASAGCAPGRMPRVSYGHARLPGVEDAAHGGMVKALHLAERWPHRPRRYNILYLISSRLPRDWAAQVRLARWKGARIVLNQDGIASPSWCAGNLERFNGPMRAILQAADHVIYQSAFCKAGADRYLGEPAAGRATWEILHNPVDTARFAPAQPPRPRDPLVLLAAGTVNARYRFETAVRALALVRQRLPGTRLLVAGPLQWSPDRRAVAADVRRLLGEAGVGDAVDLRDAFTRRDAPELFRSAHLLLHTQFNDACPTVVLEAMACGLPVVYSRSGGTPELVDEAAGVGVPARPSFDAPDPPDPVALADAVCTIAADWPRFSEAARRRAERFDVVHWLERHAALFAELLARPPQ